MGEKWTKVVLHMCDGGLKVPKWPCISRLISHLLIADNPCQPPKKSRQRASTAMENINVLLLLVGTVAFLVIVSHFFSAKHDPREPPLIPPKFPVIGHVIGMVQHGVAYLYLQWSVNTLP